MINKNQLKITKLFKKAAPRLPDEERCDELQEEVQKLVEELQQKQNELFQLQRNSYRCKPSLPKRKIQPFIKPEKIVLSNAVDNLKSELELMTLLSGIEVQSYVAEDHCCITYQMQHDASHEIKHGLRIELQDGANVVSKSSLPLGFNLNAVLEEFNNIMMPECLHAIRKALVAYYKRLEQFEALKKMLNMEAQLFKTLDGSHIRIAFVGKSEVDKEEEPFDISLTLDYRLYDIYPKKFSINETDVPEGAADLIREQCAVFKRKPLHKAFKEVFINTCGPYKLMVQVGSCPEAPRRNVRHKANRQNYNNDDTFLPEYCSDHSDDIDAE